MDVVRQILERMAPVPGRLKELAVERAQVNDKLHDTLRAIRELETQVAGEVAAEKNEDGKARFPNESARGAEVQRRLAEDKAYAEMQENVKALRARLVELDAELDELKYRQRADVSVVYLLSAAFAQAGPETAKELAQVYVGGVPEVEDVATQVERELAALTAAETAEEEAPASEPVRATRKGNGNGKDRVGEFTIKECGQTTKGKPRVVAVDASGKEHVLFPTDPAVAAQFQLKVGRKVKVSYAEGRAGYIVNKIIV